MSKRSRKNQGNENENDRENRKEPKKQKETIVLEEVEEEPALSSITNKTYSKPTVIDFTTSEYADIPLTTSATWGMKEKAMKSIPQYHLSRINSEGKRVFDSYYDPGKNIWGGITRRNKRSKRKLSKRNKRSKHTKKTRKSRRVRKR
jgi:hypothetical protein